MLVDFGKACYLKDGRTYNLSVEEQKRYAKQYPQVAPKVRQGIAPQSYKSDMFSFGRILLHVNKVRLKLPALGSMADECLSSNYKVRPRAKDLKVFVYNLSSVNDEIIT